MREQSAKRSLRDSSTVHLADDKNLAFPFLFSFGCVHKHLDEQAGREEQRQRAGDCSPTAPLLTTLYFSQWQRRCRYHTRFSSDGRRIAWILKQLDTGASLASKCSSAASEEANSHLAAGASSLGQIRFPVLACCLQGAALE